MLGLPDSHLFSGELSPKEAKAADSEAAAAATLDKPDEELSPQELVRKYLPQILNTRGREVHLKDLTVAIAGFTNEDRDEPVTEEYFSNHKAYRHFLERTVYFDEQFDFLLSCVESGVCVVRNPAVLRQLVGTLVAPPSKQHFQFPPEVIAYDVLRQKDEERRIESFTLRKDWVSELP